MMNTNDPKWRFVEDQVITNSIMAAFQRANVYSNSKSYTDPNRQDLRKRLAELLKDTGSQYQNKVVEQQHKDNIKKIADTLTSEFKEKNCLQGDRFRIGIAQKALNLYLKYLWCLDKIPVPPHCPFDFGIIAKLSLTENIQWTELDSLEHYQMLVDAANRVKDTRETLSEWELKAWE